MLKERETFNYAYDGLNSKWNTVYQQEFLGPSDLVTVDTEALEQAIRPPWSRFVADVLPKITTSVRQHFAGSEGPPRGAVGDG
jgi:hypothetical protein